MVAIQLPTRYKGRRPERKNIVAGKGSVSGWIRTARIMRVIKQQAGLKDIVWSPVFTGTARERAEKYAKYNEKLSENMSRIESWVGRTEPSEEWMDIARTLYVQTRDEFRRTRETIKLLNKKSYTEKL